MSKERQHTTVQKQTVVGARCDGCGRYEKVKESEYSSYVEDPPGWVSFRSGHNDYAEASEYDEQHDVCSFACYLKVFRDLIAENTKYGDVPRTFTADGKDEAFMRALVESVPDESERPNG